MIEENKNDNTKDFSEIGVIRPKLALLWVYFSIIKIILITVLTGIVLFLVFYDDKIGEIIFFILVFFLLIIHFFIVKLFLKGNNLGIIISIFFSVIYFFISVLLSLNIGFLISLVLFIIFVIYFFIEIYLLKHPYYNIEK